MGHIHDHSVLQGNKSTPYGALLDHNDGTTQKFLQHLKLLPKGNTTHLLSPKVYISSYLNDPEGNK